MKTKNILPIAIILAITLSLGSCKKRYPDGPLISFRSTWQRMQGKWEIWGFYINNVNKSSLVKQIDYISIFTKEPKHFWIYYKEPIDSIYAAEGIGLKLIKDKKIMEIYSFYGLITQHSPLNYLFAYPNTNTSNANDYNVKFNIRKLRYKSMVLERTAGGNNYRLELKKTSK